MSIIHDDLNKLGIVCDNGLNGTMFSNRRYRMEQCSWRGSHLQGSGGAKG